MKQLNNKGLFLAIIGLSFRILSYSQTIPITYSSYMLKVDSGNLDYAAQKLNVNIANALIIAAKVRNNPELGISYFNNEQPQKKMGYGGSVSVSQTFTFGKRSAAIELAKSESSLSESLLADYLRNLQADATISFYEALKQDKLYEIKKDAYLNINNLAKSDSIRFIKGTITEIDAIQSKVEAELMYNELLQAETNKNNSFTELSLYTGTKKATTLYQPISTLRLPYRDFRLIDLIQRGKTERADLIAAMQNVNVANKALKVTQRNNNSDVTVSLELGHNAQVKNEIAPAPSYNSITAGVSIPIPFSKLNKGNIKAAKERILQASLQYDQISLQIQNEIIKAYYQYISTSKQVQHFENGLLRQAQGVLKGKIYSYNRGETSLLDVLNAQHTYNDVQSQYHEAVFNYDIALINLERSAGIWDIK